MKISVSDIHKTIRDLTTAKTDHWQADLYVESTPEVIEIISVYDSKERVSGFKDLIDKKPWFEIPFAYNPDVGDLRKFTKVEHPIDSGLLHEVAMDMFRLLQQTTSLIQDDPALFKKRLNTILKRAEKVLKMAG